MNKKGFSLIELLTVFILLGVVAGIVYSLTDNLKKDSKLEILKTSAKKLFIIADNYNAANDYKNFPLAGVRISELEIETTNFTDGRVRINKDGEYALVNVTDGTYCINGTLENLVYSENLCPTYVPSPVEDAVMAYVILNPYNIEDGKNIPSSYDIGNASANAFVVYVNENHIIVSVNIGYASSDLDEDNIVNATDTLIIAYVNGGTPNASELIHNYTSEENNLSYVVKEQCLVNSKNYCSGNSTPSSFLEAVGMNMTSNNIVEVIF